jgi:hypothetical protein
VDTVGGLLWCDAARMMASMTRSVREEIDVKVDRLREDDSTVLDRNTHLETPTKFRDPFYDI